MSDPLPRPLLAALAVLAACTFAAVLLGGIAGYLGGCYLGLTSTSPAVLTVPPGWRAVGVVEAVVIAAAAIALDRLALRAWAWLGRLARRVFVVSEVERGGGREEAGR